MVNYDVKGVTTRGGKTTTQDVHDNDTNVPPKEPAAVKPEKPVGSNEALTNDQPQTTSELVVQPSNEQLHINLPFIEALAKMPKYAKFLKSLLTNKARLEEACKIIMNERCSAVLLNKLPPKEKDPRKPKATRMSLELADRSIQYPRGIIENVLIKVDKFVFPIDFVILDMHEDLRVPIILGRPFLATARAMIDVFNKKITLRVGDDEVIFDSNEKNVADSKNSIRRIDSANTPYPVTQGTTNGDDVKSEHLYSASANEIDEKKPELKNLPQHLEYAYLHGDKSFPIIISSGLFKKEKISLLQVLER
ncbi:reverse transcriptase domain-containing protein [Tanacetum coccineum]